nr:hypothetical protein [Microbispora rosea]
MNREDGRDGAGRGGDNREESRNRPERAGGYRGNGGNGGYGGREEERREGFRSDRGERPFHSDRRGYRDQGGPSAGRSGSRDRDDRESRAYGDRDTRGGYRDRDDRGRRSYGADERGGYRDRDGGRSFERGGDRPRGGGFEGRKERSYQDRDAARADRPRRSYGDRDDFRGGQGFRGREEGRPFRSDDRGSRPYGERRADRREGGGYGDRSQRQGGGFGGRYGFRERDSREGRDDRSFAPRYERDDRDGIGGRPARRSEQERGYGRDDRGASGYGRPDRPRRPYDDRSGDRGNDRTFGGRDGRGREDWPRRPHADRQDASGGDRYRDRDAFRDRPRRGPEDGPGRSFRDRDERRPGRDREEEPRTFRGRGPGSGDRPRRQFGGDRGTARPFSREESRPFSGDRGAARPFSRDERGGSRSRYGKPGAPKTREAIPPLDPDIKPDELDREARAELRSLPNDLADLVASHLVAAARALSAEEPEKAYEHAKVARRFAGRIGVVREATGIAAYHAGQYAEALSDLRAARRITGSDEYLPIMADCERGLGRPERALDLVRSREAERLNRASRIELAIVESGARRDLGQHDAAVITLQRVPELRDPQPKPWSARLAFAYADALADAGHLEAATDWFARAMAFDEDGETDAAERYAELTGEIIEDLEEDYDDSDEDGGLQDGLPGDEEDNDREIVEAVKDEEDQADLPGDRLSDDVSDEDEGSADIDSADIDSVNGDSVGDEPSAAASSAGGASVANGPSAPAAGEARDADQAEKPSAKESAPSYGPAFIEPDFGDMLDEPEDVEDQVKRRP